MTSLTLHARRPARGEPHPSTAVLLRDEIGYALRDLWRSRIVFVFTFLFPLTWLVVLGLVVGNATVDGGTGVRMMQFVTPTAAVMGVLYATLPTVASSLADARERGVLKRVRGTPLPTWVYLTGRMGASVVLALGSLVTMLVVGVLAYDVQVIWRTMPATLVTSVVAIACFSAAGLAVAAVARSAVVAQAASMAAAVVLGFISGVLIVGDLPTWTDRVASVFPLRAYNEAVKAQFDPFGSGAGWDPGTLLMLAAWTVAAGAIAVRFFRWDPAPAGRKRTAPVALVVPPSPEPVLAAPATVAPAVVPRPSWAGMLLSQIRWATRAALRDPGWVFFAIAMPVGLYALMASVIPEEAPSVTGAPITLEIAAGMTAWGAAVTAFISMPEAVAVARDRGVLKRLRGTPLRPALYLAGRTVSALWIALLTGALVLVVGLLAFGLEISWTGLPLAAGMLLLGTTAMAACGLALTGLLPSSKALTAVGLVVLLPLAFFSDVFAISQVPEWMGTVGSFLPLKHMANSVSLALDPAGPSFEWLSLAVMSAWLLGAGMLAMRTFRWTGRS